MDQKKSDGNTFFSDNDLTKTLSYESEKHVFGSLFFGGAVDQKI